MKKADLSFSIDELHMPFSFSFTYFMPDLQPQEFLPGLRLPVPFSWKGNMARYSAVLSKYHKVEKKNLNEFSS